MKRRIDPWGTELLEDYERLFTEFGLSYVDERMLSMVRKSRLFRRGIIFAHRDFDKFLDDYNRGKKVAVISGIKPSCDFHLGSKLTAEELVFLQKEFGTKVFYCVANLEAYADNGLSFQESREIAVRNVADLLALGLDPKNAYIYEQSQEKDVMQLGYLFARKTTMATLRALYGERNLSLYMSTMTQAGDILLPQMERFGGPKRVVVPVGIDQDPHIRLTRDIAAKFQKEFGFIPPSATYHRFFKALNGETKMSKRDPMSMLSLGDDPELARRKIMNTFTGGRATVEEQRRRGGDIKRCVVFELFAFHFEENDEKLEERRRRCLSGRILCGECKRELADRVVRFLRDQQAKRKRFMEKARRILEEGEGR